MKTKTKKKQITEAIVCLSLVGLFVGFSIAGYRILHQGGASHDYNTHYLHE
ncbi:hypothetical protein [Thalassoporum mexicanum]|uniref:hypothetical protein n=1 Tax=Thalassoporum mexicanum TaxID=3457544 RepID=UPI0002E3BB3E|nr:hypothetical protein [Pseudanabaena sp. PCC 7367]